VLRHVCKGKIHRATVTQADLNYMGSITIDRRLMTAANIRPFEMVQITNLSTGTLWHTYAIEGEVNSGTLCLNGPPARHFQVGDKVIVLSLAYVTDDEWEQLSQSVVYVDDHNRIMSVVSHPLNDNDERSEDGRP
jgi:aspartate 1-decarboxylase